MESLCGALLVPVRVVVISINPVCNSRLLKINKASMFRSFSRCLRCCCCRWSSLVVFVERGGSFQFSRVICF